MKSVLPPILLILLICSRGLSASQPSASAAGRLHPDFDFTAEDIDRRLKNLPETAHTDYREFLRLLREMGKIPAFQLRLVDKFHALKTDESPPILVELTDGPGLRVSRGGLRLERRSARALMEMAAAAADDGITLVVSSAYRSFEYQDNLFRRYAETYGEEEASRFSAKPGMSQHQLGTVVDFGDITNYFADSSAGRWMTANAGKYGWSLSYPRGTEEITGYRWESWHWRWIGPDAVRMQDVFFDGSQQRLLEFWDGNAQEIANSRTERRTGTLQNRSP